MRIFTSYFANWRYFPKDIKQVSVARYSPKGFRGESLPSLFPSSNLLYGYKNGEVSEQAFVIEYKEYLSKLNFHKVLKDLKTLCDNKDCVLLCYEKTGDFCHRHLIAEWFKENGITIKELE